MGNTLKSLIVATSMIAAGSHAEGTSNKVDETKRTIQELILSLDASKYGAARGVLGGDEALLADGDISPQDAETIQLHANKLLGIAPEKAKAILEALNGNGGANNGEQVQIDEETAPQAPKSELGPKKIPALDETPQQRKERLVKEKFDKDMAEKQAKITKDRPKLLINFNKSVLVNGWEANKQDGETKMNYGKGDHVSFELKKGTKGGAEREVLVAPGTYSVDLEVTGGMIVFWIERPDGTNERKQLGKGHHNLGAIQNVRLGCNLSTVSPLLILKKLALTDETPEVAVTVK